MGWLSSLIGGVVGFFVGGPVGAVIGAGIGATKVGEKVVNTVLDFVTQPFMPDIPSIDTTNAAEAERQQGVLFQTQGSTVNVPVVYGYRKVGGAVVFAETGATNNKYLYVAYVFSEGLVEGLREVYIDDWLLPTDQVGSLNAGQLVTVNSDRYKDRVQLRWYPGVYYTNPSASTVGSTVKSGIFAEAPSFTSSMNFNGLAVLFARYEWKEIKTQADADNNPFSGSIPQVQVSMLGKRVASLTVDTTETTPYDANIIRYSTNPAECLLDYLRNPRYGKGLVNEDIDWNSWKWAARKCNTTVTYVASGIQGPILTCNAVIDTGQNIMSNTKNFLQNFRAYMPYVQGKYKLRIEDAGNPTDILSGAATIVATMTQNDIISDITYQGIDRSSKYNVVSVTYVDPDQKWSNQQVVYPETEAERQVYIDKDGGRENKYDVTFGHITNYAIAKDMARLIFNKQRRQETCTFTATSRALELEPGDCIRIQSKILDFGADPWRIVSVSVNDDMTVDLGCVRNPDDIYPYVRVGEEDIVLPTYIPKGSIIYYPSSQNQYPVGLVPPQYAVFPPDATGTSDNPFPTDPNSPTGGGVGGSSTDTTTNNPGTNTDNNTSGAAPVVVPFDFVLTYKSTTLEKVDTNNSRFNLTFVQPNTSLYDYSIMWWRINQYSPWNTVRIEERPGPGQDIKLQIGPLPNLGQYDYFIRCYATDGRASTNVTKGYFRAVQSQTIAGAFVGTGSGSTQAAGDGWTLPPSLAPEEKWYDDEIGELTIKPILTGGAPQNPRRLRVTMSQVLYTFTAKINPLLAGIYVYYKYKDDTYWTREQLDFPSDYFGGKQVSWDLAGDFGAPAYPNSALYSPTAFQTYDFIVRLRYSDGTTAQKQLQQGRGPIEQNGTGLYDFVVYGTEGTNPYFLAKNETVTATNGTIPTTDQDPNNLYPVGSDIVPNIFSMVADSTISKITWYFNPPTNSKFRGYRLRYREIIPGADPDFYTVDIPAGTDLNTGKIIFVQQGNGYSHSKKYEWVLTARYSNAGIDTECTNSLYARAMIPFGVSSGTNLVNSYVTWETKDTKTAIGEITAAFPAVATIVPQKWVKKQLAKVVSSDASFIQAAEGIAESNADIKKDSAGARRLNRWYQLTFQAPNQTFTNLIVYRRVFSNSGSAKTTVGSTAKYYGLGPWERVVIPRANLTDLGSGVYSVNVRGPLHNRTFDPGYQITAGKTLYLDRYGPAPSRFPYKNAPAPYLENMYPYYGCGNKRDTDLLAEFLFVLDDGGEGTKGCRLTEFFADSNGQATAAGFIEEVDGIQTAGIPRDDYKTIADYNTFDAGFLRNISEALTGITISQLSGNNYWGGSTAVPGLNSAYSAYVYFLQQPAGYTVY